MNRFKIIAVTHKHFDIADIGKFHIDEKEWESRLSDLKTKSGADELLFLSTCNRVEFLLNTSVPVDKEFLVKFIGAAFPSMEKNEVVRMLPSVQVWENEEALSHLFNVASSLDSLVVGEREIITQVRNAYEQCHRMGLTGDLLRLVIQKTIECAKDVYTKTNIASKPVSVVSLAYRKLKELHVKPDSRFLMLGAGVTSTTMGKYLKKHGVTNFAVFNRTPENGKRLASELGGKYYPLDELRSYKEGFDVLVTCTGSTLPVVTTEVYASLVGSDKEKKIVMDLAVPGDLDPSVPVRFDMHSINITSLKSIAERNLLEREKEMDACSAIIRQHIGEFHQLFKTRKVEIAMSDVPKKVKEIRETAVNEVFAKEIQKLDEQSKETLDKIIAYLEKKYISVPMKMAKEILMDEVAAK